MLFTGQVPEREIAAVAKGMQVAVALISGETAMGEVRYISPAADPQTRTFEVEVALQNGDGRLRDGMTATATVPLPPIAAYKLDANWLTLDDSGEIGLRAVGSDNVVAFLAGHRSSRRKPMACGCTGWNRAPRFITLGQNYVAAGEKVDPVPAVDVGDEGEDHRGLVVTSALAVILSRPKTVLMMMLVMVIAGAISYISIPKEADPDIDVPVYFVSVFQQGISPSDAERLLVRPMESKLRGLDGLKGTHHRRRPIDSNRGARIQHRDGQGRSAGRYPRQGGSGKDRVSGRCR